MEEKIPERLYAGRVDRDAALKAHSVTGRCFRLIATSAFDNWPPVGTKGGKQGEDEWSSPCLEK